MDDGEFSIRMSSSALTVATCLSAATPAHASQPLDVPPPVAASDPQSGEQSANTAQAGQPNADQPTSFQGDIVITAQRRGESLQKVPLTINAVSARALTNAGILDTEALQAIIPGLVVNNIGANSSIFLRGVGSRAANAGLEPSTATYQDDRYIAGSQGNLFELMDVERVEVVKGPQGVLFGRNATAGAIRVITKDVQSRLGGYAEASYGNYNEYQLRGTINVPFGAAAGMRLSAMTHHRDGFAKNLVSTGRNRMNDEQVSAVRAKFKVEPANGIMLRLTVDASREDDSNNLATVVLPPYNLSTLTAAGAVTGKKRSEFASAIASKQKQRTFGTEFRADFDVGFADFASITTYGRNRTAYPIDFDGTNVVATDVDKLTAGNKTFTQEIQLLSKDTDRLEWLVGANYYHNKAFIQTILSTPVGRLTPNGHQTAWTQSYAAFGQLTWHLSDQFALIAGGRYTDDKIKLLLEQVPGVINALPLNLLPFRDSVSFKKFTPKAAVQWNIDSQRMFYASYSRGFKSGGFSNPATPPNVVVEPEVLDNYEIGLKGNVGRALSFALSAFYYDYKDLQVSSSIIANGVPITLTTNAADASVKGVEFEANYRALPNLNFSGAFSYLDGKYDNYPSAIAPYYRADTATPGNGLGMITGVPIDGSGRRMLRMPKWSGSVTTNYQAPVRSGAVEASATYSFKSSYDFDFVQTQNTRNLRQEGFGLVSGTIGYRHDAGRWKLSAYGTNLTNAKYFVLRQAGPTGVFGTYGEPRTYGLRFEKTF
jgi:iron complex outermembrane receptor protein